MTSSRSLPIISFLILLAAFCLHPTRTHASGDAKTKLIQQQKKIDRLKKGIEEHTERISKSTEKEGSLLAELDKIDKRLTEENEQLQTLNNMLTEQEEALRNTQDEVARVSEEKAQRQGPVKNRLVAYYRVGDIGIMNLLFSASTLPELLKFKEYFHRVVQYDQKIINNYRQTISDLGRASLDLENKKAQLVKTIADITAQQQKLELVRAEQAALLKRVKTEKILYSRAVKEMQSAAKDLSKTIQKLKEAEEKQKKAVSKKQPHLHSPKKKRPKGRKPSPDDGFVAMKGYLPPPVDNGTITTRFGRNVTKQFGITTIQDGIDITTKPGAEIHAIHEGTVAYSGVLNGYGNVVIINHGDQHYSLYSRMAKRYTEDGLKIKGGQTIGVMSDGAGLLAEGLHFEIRTGTKPVDPLQWIDVGKLKTKNY